MLFLMLFGRFPEKFSLGIFFSPSKPNTIRLNSLPLSMVAIPYIIYESVNNLRMDLSPHKVQLMENIPPTQAAFLPHVH